jgi:hypothetical protein
MIYTKESAMLAVKNFKEGKLVPPYWNEYKLLSEGNNVIFDSCASGLPHFRYSSELNDFEMVNEPFGPMDFSGFRNC